MTRTREASLDPVSHQGALRVAYLGPPGTFTEQALVEHLGLVESPGSEISPFGSVEEVVEATAAGNFDIGFVPIENSIEGTVNATLDSLVFDCDLLIQREVIMDVHLDLMAVPGTDLTDIERVLSFPHASAQCRNFLSRRLTQAEVLATNSTAEAARVVGTNRLARTAALAPTLSASLYGLEVIASSVEDHPDNQTRFFALARAGIPPVTGHDKTSIVCFQSSDKPGSLHSILGQFAARGINLTKLESRPTKRSLGAYCFIVDMEGHLADEVVADCLRDLHAMLARVKFLGSYPAAGEKSTIRRREAVQAWQAADEWVATLRGQIRNGVDIRRRP